MSQTLQAEAALTATDLPTYRLPSRAGVVSYCGQHVRPRAMDVDAYDVAMQVASAQECGDVAGFRMPATQFH